MLRELRAGVMAELHRRYAAAPTSIRAYFHYPPSFWHAHVHFAALTCPAMGANVAARKARALTPFPFAALDRHAAPRSICPRAKMYYLLGDPSPNMNLNAWTRR